MKTKYLLISFTLALGLMVALLWLLVAAPASQAQAGTGIIRVATTGTDAPGCGGAANPCATVQHAVDQAQSGDEIRIATGVYTGVQGRPAPEGYFGPSVITQVVYISKSLTLRGGYSGDFATWDPATYTTTLDAEGQGRVIFVADGVTVTLEGLYITNGDAAGLGGRDRADWGFGGGLYAQFAALSLSDSTVFSNTANSSPSARGEGGGIFAYESVITVSGSVIQSNTTSKSGQGNGGGLYIDGGSGRVTGNLLRNNTANEGGGAVFEPYAVPYGEVVVEGNQFISNTAYAGGGVRIHTDTYRQDRVRMEDNLIQGNVALAEYGGGVLVWVGRATLLRNTIVSNTIQTTAGGYGGGLHLYRASVTMEGNGILSNTASTSPIYYGFGGGLSINNSVVTMDGDRIVGNVADKASPRGEGGGVIAFQSTMTLTGVTIANNVAAIERTGYGGGLYLSGGDYALIDSTITGNTASVNGTGQGGGLYGYGGLTMQRTLIAWNTAGGSAGVGGGTYLTHNARPFTLDNNAVVGNQAEGGGAGIYFAWLGHLYPIRLRHNTLVRNQGPSGIYVDETRAGGYPLEMTNTILVSHTVGITVSANATVTMDGVLWSGNLADTGGDGALTISHPVTGDPALAPDGYHLTYRSAAIDQGVDAGVTDDLDGQVRPMRAAPDLGADEYPYGAVLFPATGITFVYTDSQGLTTTVELPAGAVTEVLALTFVPLVSPTHPLSPGMAFAGHAFDLDVYRDGEHLPGYAFQRPVTVTIRYSDADVEGISEKSLGLYYWSGGWQDAAGSCAPPSGYIRDLGGNGLGLPICHLSRYSMQGTPGGYRLYLPLVLRDDTP